MFPTLCTVTENVFLTSNATVIKKLFFGFPSPANSIRTPIQFQVLGLCQFTSSALLDFVITFITSFFQLKVELSRATAVEM